MLEVWGLVKAWPEACLMRLRTRCCFGFASMAAAIVLVAQWTGAAAEPRGRSDGSCRPRAVAGAIPGHGPATCGSSQISTFIHSRLRWLPAPKPCRLRLPHCGNNGLIVDCLMRQYSSVSIRRLEACLGSETLPANPVDVEAALQRATE